MRITNAEFRGNTLACNELNVLDEILRNRILKIFKNAKLPFHFHGWCISSSICMLGRHVLHQELMTREFISEIAFKQERIVIRRHLQLCVEDRYRLKMAACLRVEEMIAF